MQNPDVIIHNLILDAQANHVAAGAGFQKIIAAHGEALVAMNEASKTPEQHWYPCGFAWAYVKVRKNHKLAQTLRDIGYKWDDYRKHYYFSMSADMVKADGMWQSMDYRARCLNAFAAELRERGIPCNVETRID